MICISHGFCITAVITRIAASVQFVSGLRFNAVCLVLLKKRILIVEVSVGYLFDFDSYLDVSNL